MLMLTKIITKQNIRVNPFSVGEGTHGEKGRGTAAKKGRGTAEERVGARRRMVRR